MRREREREREEREEERGIKVQEAVHRPPGVITTARRVGRIPRPVMRKSQ